MSDAFALGPTEGTRSDLPGGSWRIDKLTVDVTGSWGVAEEMSPPGFEAPWHIHHTEDGVFFILEGALLMRLGDMEVEATPGTLVFMPRDIPHTFKVVSDVPARWINVQGPTGDFGKFTREMDAATKSGLPPGDIVALSKKYGLEFVRAPDR